ncbi:MAG: PIN domain-containing protein [Planctomycetaceae bacterium]|nr:PIN domain-containing protein [Planctomycetaceae bacterium]
MLRLAEPSHTSHTAVADAVEQMRRSGRRLVILPQIVYEFWAVATRSMVANGLGMTAAEADRLIDEFTRRIPVVRDERGVYERWRELVTSYRVSGVNSFDARIVAGMLRHGIPTLLTTNARDFAKYTEIEVLTPENMSPSVGSE